MASSQRPDAPRQTVVTLVLVVAWTLAPAAAQTIATPDPETAQNVDAFIRHVFATQDTAQYDAAVTAYFDLLNGEALIRDQADRDVLTHHLRLALRVMPPSERPSVSADRLEGADLLSVGRTAADWWRRQDPFPGTRPNERLEEHLARLSYAHEAFPADEDGGEQDARADVFIRYGPPERKLNVRLNDVIRAFDVPSTYATSTLPDNEFWVYPHLHDEAHFFFVRDARRGPYRLGLPSEIIPGRLQTGLNQRTERGRQKTEIVLMLLEEVYAHLALAHDFYGSTLDRIILYRSLPPSQDRRPEQFVRSTLGDAGAREIEAAGRRERVLPASFSNVEESIDALPVEMRWARFLEPDGSTRIEIFWQVDPRTITPAEEASGDEASDLYLLSISVAQRSPDYRMLDLNRTHYGVRPAEHAVLPVRSFMLESDSPLIHLGVQWDVHRAVQIGGEVQPVGAALKRATARIDSVAALHSGGQRLEMSDLKPVLVTSTVGHQTPIADPHLPLGAPPHLYFELYNLHFGPDDRTRYTVAYEVVRNGSQRTTAQSAYSGSERSAQEIIEVDLGDEAPPGPVRINVHVTDEVTGEGATRSILFER